MAMHIRLVDDFVTKFYNGGSVALTQHYSPRFDRTSVSVFINGEMIKDIVYFQGNVDFAFDLYSTQYVMVRAVNSGQRFRLNR